MRRLLVFVVLACGSASVGAQAPESKDAAVLAAAREALGGDARLSAVKAFVATGRTRQVRGENLVPVEFEISCALPDKFARKDEIPAQESGPTTTGFNGEELIQIPPPAAPPSGPPSTGGGPPAGRPNAANAAAARTLAAKQDFARLTLGMFATSFPSYPLTFAHVGLAEAPQGQADVLEVKGAGNFTLRYFVDRQTHLPIMVSWTVPATNVVMVIPGQPAPASPPPGTIVVDAPAPPAATAPKAELDAYNQSVQALRKKTLSEAKPVENRVYYSDYRDVDGMKFPFRIRRAVAGQTIEETTFDRFKINPKIDPKKFGAK